MPPKNAGVMLGTIVSAETAKAFEEVCSSMNTTPYAVLYAFITSIVQGDCKVTKSEGKHE